MKILVAHLGTLLEVFVASSINKGLCKKYYNPEITWVLGNETTKSLLKYHSKLKEAITCEELIARGYRGYDKFINLHPLFKPTNQISEEFKSIFSDTFGYYQHSEEYILYDSILYAGKETNMSMFQVYFRLAGMVWRGEGYDIKYFPKTKSKKKRAGIAIVHANLRNFITENIDLKSMKTWIVPYKKNVFKHMDEINRCHNIVTDDLLVLNLALYLRKKVNFLETIHNNMKTELFGMGKIYPVSSYVIK